jgi:hypothetical protein
MTTDSRDSFIFDFPEKDVFLTLRVEEVSKAT